MLSLAELERDGWVTDEWAIWQQGWCGTYAVALMMVRPSLRLGMLVLDLDDGWMPLHFFAHDNAFAYDSAGRHPLPYTGLDPDVGARCELDVGPADDYGLPGEEAGPEGAEFWLAKALGHITRHTTLSVT